MRSPELYHHLLDHGDEYRALVYGPYVFWPAYAGSQLLPERSVLWTCLHDEPAAYLDLFQPVLSGIAGLFFQTEPEHALAHRVSPRLAPHAVVGCGVEIPESYDPEGFRQRYGLPERFVLYAGRREGAKGWEDMLAAYARAVENGGLPLNLVTFGTGEVRPPASVAELSRRTLLDAHTPPAATVDRVVAEEGDDLESIGELTCNNEARVEQQQHRSDAGPHVVLVVDDFKLRSEIGLPDRLQPAQLHHVAVEAVMMLAQTGAPTFGLRIDAHEDRAELFQAPLQ